MKSVGLQFLELITTLWSGTKYRSGRVGGAYACAFSWSHESSPASSHLFVSSLLAPGARPAVLRCVWTWKH